MSKSTKSPKRARTFRFGGGAIIGIIAIVQGSRFAVAFHLADVGHAAQFGQLAIIIDLMGGALGLATSLGIGYVASIMPGIKAQERSRWVKVALVVLLVIAPFILAPVTVAGMDEGLRHVLADVWSQWLWAVITASAPDIVIAAISMADQNLLSVAQPAVSVAEPALSHSSASPATAQPRSASSQPAKQVAEPTLYRCECGKTDAKRQVIIGHQRACAIHLAAKAGAAIPVELPKPEGAKRS